MDVRFEDSLSFELHMTDLFLTGHARARLSGVGIAPEQNLVVLLLRERHPLTQGQIAEALGKDKTNIAKVLATLEEKGLVERAVVAGDRRALAVSLTPTGRRTAALTAPIAERFQADLVGDLPPETLTTFLATLHALRANLEHRSTP